ncbi:hypothetical protein BGZ60DRAFT_68664 [Tricladium varicosporioides]|nr:hypothetical protein BGZ60DRAFT_68664 [Hymenoscyphus varicosporioides]
MQFSIAAVAFMASSVMAGAVSTVYSTAEVTITSCAASVTDCPARSTVVSKTTFPVVATSPSVYYNSSIPVYTPVPSTKSVNEGVVSASPSLSVVAISSCVPTVVYSTITVTPSVYTPAPSSTGSIYVPKNVTAPSATATPTTYVTSGAAGLSASAAFAVVAGLAAAYLA